MFDKIKILIGLYPDFDKSLKSNNYKNTILHNPRKIGTREIKSILCSESNIFSNEYILLLSQIQCKPEGCKLIFLYYILQGKTQYTCIFYLSNCSFLIGLDLWQNYGQTQCYTSIQFYYRTICLQVVTYPA